MTSEESAAANVVQAPEYVLDIWFRDEMSGRMDLPQARRWFMGGKTLDDALEREFGATLEAAANGQLVHWLDTAHSTLALIIVMDQFNRNINRGTAKAFALDPQALSACKHSLTRGYADQLPITQRVFCYMPLEHDESVESQTESVALFSRLVDESPEELREFAQRALDSALEHQAIIAQFGRYPHRNEALGRTSTDEELQWLQEKNKRFGQ